MVDSDEITDDEIDEVGRECDEQTGSFDDPLADRGVYTDGGPGSVESTYEPEVDENGNQTGRYRLVEVRCLECGSSEECECGQ